MDNLYLFMFARSIHLYSGFTSYARSPPPQILISRVQRHIHNRVPPSNFVISVIVILTVYTTESGTIVDLPNESYFSRSRQFKLTFVSAYDSNPRNKTEATIILQSSVSMSAIFDSPQSLSFSVDLV